MPDQPENAEPNHEWELSEARRELRAARSRLESVAAERDLAAKRLQAERELSERYRHQLMALRNSTSWRVTRPIRMLRRKVFQRGEF
ncbi:hypothetical protein [Mycetocola sp. 2940]|uniref:hypothetical protein n=1 Tax=Mycetocola sp. 2940 TaxID=3156452 RepID=UPI003398B9D0